MMTTLQLSASFGEMFCPFVIGIAFQFRRYELFYLLSAQTLLSPDRLTMP